jgi:dihydrofolate reductase
VTRPRIAVVAAVARNGVIGRDNHLVWRLRSDLRRFREITLGKPVIMGRKTYESIGKPLPGRDNVVMTRDRGFAAPGLVIAHGWDDARNTAARLAAASGASEIMVIGGAEVYGLALPDADRLRLTLVEAEPEGDAMFPSFDRVAFIETHREAHPVGPEDEHPFTFLDLERRAAAPEA